MRSVRLAILTAVALLCAPQGAWAADFATPFLTRSVSAGAPGTVPWTNPELAGSRDDRGAQALGVNYGEVTAFLESTQPSTGGIDIPAGAAIEGVVVTVTRQRGSSQPLRDHTIQLIVGGSRSGANRSAGALWPSVATATPYGGATDTWGLPLTREQVLAPDFGVAIAATNASSTGVTASVDSVRITIYWTAAPTPPGDVRASDVLIRLHGAPIPPGEASNDGLGRSAAAIGDTNGDGRQDFIVGASGAVNPPSSTLGAAYVIYGRPGPATLDAGALTVADGYRILPPAGGGLGTSVAAAGDVNGDGLADVVVGSESATSRGRKLNGSAFVVFGRTGGSDVRLDSLGSRGFRIEGARASSRTGVSVDGAGDVNGDGLSDVVVGAPRQVIDGDSVAGAAYVVFGKASSAAVDLLPTLSPAGSPSGYAITGGQLRSEVGTKVAGAGDVNGDGRPDVLVGVPDIMTGAFDSGAIFAVFGKASTARVRLPELGAGGFGVFGRGARDRLGEFDFDDVGDLDGDGRADFVASTGSGVNPGYAAVTFGKATGEDIVAGDFGTGYLITGDQPAQHVAGVPDIGGSPAPDTLVGTRAVFGKATGGDIDTTSLGAGGFNVSSGGGVEVAALPGGGVDLAGDARPDLLVEVRLLDGTGRAGLYVVPVP